MRLDEARLCLDCEEIHTGQECPACGSEAFGFLTRWIKSSSSDRPASGKPPVQPARQSIRETASADQLDAWRRIVEPPSDGGGGAGRARTIVTRSLFGLAAMGLASWAWAKTRPEEKE